MCASLAGSLANVGVDVQAFLSFHCGTNILIKIDTLGLEYAVCISCIALYPGISSLLLKAMSGIPRTASCAPCITFYTQSPEFYEPFELCNWLAAQPKMIGQCSI